MVGTIRCRTGKARYCCACSCGYESAFVRLNNCEGTIQRARAEGEPQPQGTALLEHHLLRVADGLEPAEAAQASCASAMQDGPVSAQTQRFASYGRASNALRDSLRLSGQFAPCNLQPWHVKIPCRKSRASDSEIHEVQHPIFMPHEIVHALHAAKPDKFMQLMLGEAGMHGLQTFWEKADSHEWAQMHPARTDMAGRICIPIVLHGDDVQYKKTGHESIAAISFHPELGEATTRLSRYLIAAVPLAWSTRHTLQPIFFAIKFSLECMLQGTFPDADEYGRPFAPGSWRARVAGQPLLPMQWSFAFSGFVADWKFLKEAFMLPRHYGKPHCCHRCLATKKLGPNFAYDPRPDAGWRSTMTSTEEFLQLAPASPLTQLPGFHIQLMKADIMHLLHLGICMHMVACTLIELCASNTFSEVPRRSSLNRKLHAAWVRFRDWCSARGIAHSQVEFTKARCGVKTGQSPCMLSYAAKAHNMRVVSAWLSDECQNSPDMQTRRGRLRASCCFAFANFSFELDTSARHLDDHPLHLQRIVQNGYDFIYAYLELNRQAARRRLKRYAVTPKMHAFMHCLDDMQALQYSARYHTCYREEDFVGRASAIATSCSARNVGLRCLQRWWMGIVLRLKSYT